MLIIASGATIIFGMIQLGLMGQKKLITENSSEYAKIVQAKNAAFTAIQLAMEKINEDDSWHPTQGSPWETEVEGADITFYYEILGAGATALDPDTIRVYSEAEYFDETATIVSTYTKELIDFVPEFEAALSFATDQFTFSMGGSATINGNDASGTCSDKPGITVQDAASATKVVSGAGSKIGNITSSTGTQVAVNPDLSYSPVDEMIARLYGQPGTQTISGNYKGSMGTASDPGVFFVENYAKLTGGISAGHGILVIRSGGELEYEGELSVAGNFEWNGLIIFENAFDFDGKGTPDLKGSVLVGTTDGSSSTLDVDISGNINIQYDCSAEEYAKMASAKLLKQNRYTRLSTFE